MRIGTKQADPEIRMEKKNSQKKSEKKGNNDGGPEWSDNKTLYKNLKVELAYE